MARRSAINVVAEAVVAALNVPAVRTLCPGGVYRNRPQAQTPPFVSVGPCRERSEDAFGLTYGAIVTVPVRVVTSGADANGESRAMGIIDKVMELLDEPATWPAMTGWTPTLVSWLETAEGDTDIESPEALPYTAGVTFEVHVSVS